MNRHPPPVNPALKEALQRVGIGTPRSAVDALIEEHLGSAATLLGKRGQRRPSRKSNDPAERNQAEEAPRVRHSNSLTQIARMLDCEGFNEFAAFGVLHYARTQLWGQKWGDEAERRRAKVAESMRPLSDDQRKAAGEFIHYQAAASFEAGMRIGLMASLWTLMIQAEKGTELDEEQRG